MSVIRPHVPFGTLRAFLDIFLAFEGNRFGLLGPKNSRLLVANRRFLSEVQPYDSITQPVNAFFMPVFIAMGTRSHDGVASKGVEKFTTMG